MRLLLQTPAHAKHKLINVVNTFPSRLSCSCSQTIRSYTDFRGLLQIAAEKLYCPTLQVREVLWPHVREHIPRVAESHLREF